MTHYQEPWKVKKSGGQSPWRARRARAYNGDLGAEPQQGPGAEPLVRGSGGEALQKLKAFLFQDVTQSNQGKRFRFLFLLSFKVIV